MTDKKDYEVGFGKPPKHTQFKKGESGFKGRKHKPPETRADIVKRVWGEVHKVRDPRTGKIRRMTSFELMIVNMTKRLIMKGGVRDLLQLYTIFDKSGVTEMEDRATEWQRMVEIGAAQARESIVKFFDRTWPENEAMKIARERERKAREPDQGQ